MKLSTREIEKLPSGAHTLSFHAIRNRPRQTIQSSDAQARFWVELPAISVVIIQIFRWVAG